MLHVEFSGTEQRESLSFGTLDEAMNAIRSCFPHSIRAMQWYAADSSGPLGWDGMHPEDGDHWNLASLWVWATSLDMENDRHGDKIVAMIVNEGDVCPED